MPPPPPDTAQSHASARVWWRCLLHDCPAATSGCHVQHGTPADAWQTVARQRHTQQCFPRCGLLRRAVQQRLRQQNNSSSSSEDGSQCCITRRICARSIHVPSWGAPALAAAAHIWLRSRGECQITLDTTPTCSCESRSLLTKPPVATRASMTRCSSWSCNRAWGGGKWVRRGRRSEMDAVKQRVVRCSAVRDPTHQHMLLWSADQADATTSSGSKTNYNTRITETHAASSTQLSVCDSAAVTDAFEVHKMCCVLYCVLYCVLCCVLDALTCSYFGGSSLLNQGCRRMPSMVMRLSWLTWEEHGVEGLWGLGSCQQQEEK